MDTLTPSVSTVCTINLWCKEGTHDKVYRLEVQESNGRYDVFATYGRRGGKMTMHIIASDLPTLSAAMIVYNEVHHQKLWKGYRPVNEDVMHTSNLTIKEGHSIHSSMKS